MASQQVRTVAGKPVGPIGFGLMGFAFNRYDFEGAAKVMKKALEQGSNFWNGGIFYGSPDANSLHLLKYYFEKYPEDTDKVVICIKGCYDFMTHAPQGSPEQVRASVNEAYAVLKGVKTIDIFEMARVDPKVPIETSITALKELVDEGLIGAVGLSEVSAATIRRAAKIAKIAAVEIELSLFTPDGLNNGVVQTCHELGIPVAAYSPISRGWLTGDLRSLDDLPKHDFRRNLDRFRPETFEQNLKLVKAVESIAKAKGVTTAQLAINWARQQGTIPIPGTVKEARVVENCKVFELSEEELKAIKETMDAIPVAGLRYGGKSEELLSL